MIAQFSHSTIASTEDVECQKKVEKCPEEGIARKSEMDDPYTLHPGQRLSGVFGGGGQREFG